MNLTNYHSHSTFCDGHAPMEMFVEAALAAGFSSYGFSSHAPLPYHTRWNMDAADMNAYLTEAARLKAKYAQQIELYVGLEIDYLTPIYNAAIPYFAQLPLDYRIGSLHTITDKNGQLYEIDCKIEQFREIVCQHFDGDVEYVLNQYIDRLEAMITVGGIDIVGHADKMHLLADQMRPQLSSATWYKQRMEHCFELMREKDYVVEINTKKYQENGHFFPDVCWWPLMRQMGIRVMVNSDAHFPEKINNGRPEALRQLQGVGYSHVVEIHGGIMTLEPILTL